jgi:hypothetical protein
MKRFPPVFFATIMFAGCTTNDQSAELQQIQRQLTALSDSIGELKDSLRSQQADTVALTPVKPVKVPDSLRMHSKPVVTTPKKTEPKPPVKPVKLTNDTIYHYYVNKKVSVRLDPWKNDERKVHFYDLQGVETFNLTEINKSYSETVFLKFAPNGSVATAEIHNNPGASMYWYETEIKFSTTNEPLSKISHRMPFSSMDQMTNEKWVYWNKRTGQWEEQQQME